ncbi:MAG: hypothetical protein VX640_06595 [Pseudomonadota bacterium]|nr:hypothetical protein [Pseudomonadota bacterium]
MTAHTEATVAGKRYSVSVIVWMTVYAGLIVAMSWAQENDVISAPWIYVAAVSPALPIGAVILAMMRFLADSDEFVRLLIMKRYLAAMGLTLFACAFFGFLDQYTAVFRPPLWIVFPGFWFCFGLVSPFIRSST